MGMPGARSRKDKSRGSFLGLMQLVQRPGGIGADAEPWMIEHLFGRVLPNNHPRPEGARQPTRLVQASLVRQEVCREHEHKRSAPERGEAPDDRPWPKPSDHINGTRKNESQLRGLVLGQKYGDSRHHQEHHRPHRTPVRVLDLKRKKHWPKVERQNRHILIEVRWIEVSYLTVEDRRVLRVGSVEQLDRVQCQSCDRSIGQQFKRDKKRSDEPAKGESDSGLSQSRGINSRHCGGYGERAQGYCRDKKSLVKGSVRVDRPRRIEKHVPDNDEHCDECGVPFE